MLTTIKVMMTMKTEIVILVSNSQILIGQAVVVETWPGAKVTEMMGIGLVTLMAREAAVVQTSLDYNSEGEAEAHGVAQEEQTSSDNSGSAAEFQDQQESQDTTSQDQPSTSVDITSNSKGDSSEVNS
jgi:hypothetical protein